MIQVNTGFLSRTGGSRTTHSGPDVGHRRRGEMQNQDGKRLRLLLNSFQFILLLRGLHGRLIQKSRVPLHSQHTPEQKLAELCEEVRFVGTTQFAGGDWIGIELDATATAELALLRF